MALAMTSTNLCSRGALGHSVATTRRTGRATSMKGQRRVVSDAARSAGSSSNSKPAATAVSRASGVESTRPRPPPLAAFAADAPTAAAADAGAGPVIPTLRELRQSIPAECFEPDLAESLKYAALDLTAWPHVSLSFGRHRHSSRFVPCNHPVLEVPDRPRERRVCAGTRVRIHHKTMEGEHAVASVCGYRYSSSPHAHPHLGHPIPHAHSSYPKPELINWCKPCWKNW
jgi:hypothetical protein